MHDSSAACCRSGHLSLLFTVGLQNLVDDAVLDGVVRVKVPRPGDVLLQLVGRVPCALGQDADDLLLGFPHFVAADVHVGGLHLGEAGHGLPQHDGPRRQGGPLPLFSSSKQHGGFAKGVSHAQGGDRGLDIPHEVIDCQGLEFVPQCFCSFLNACRIDVHEYRFRRVVILQVHQLGQQQLCDGWNQGHTQVDNPLFEQEGGQVRGRLLCCVPLEHWDDRLYIQPACSAGRSLGRCTSRRSESIPSSSFPWQRGFSAIVARQVLDGRSHDMQNNKGTFDSVQNRPKV